jgi:ferritin
LAVLFSQKMPVLTIEVTLRKTVFCDNLHKMKLSPKIEKALNNQLNLEFASAYVYLGMAAYFEQTPFSGFARWMEVQHSEELGHSKKFFKYIAERNGKIKLQAVAEPKSEYKSALEVFQASLAHEQKVSASIAALFELAGEEKDFATQSFLKWFLDEQVEEEKNVGDLVTKLELVGDNRNGTFQLDHQAGKRGQS